MRVAGAAAALQGGPTAAGEGAAAGVVTVVLDAVTGGVLTATGVGGAGGLGTAAGLGATGLGAAGGAGLFTAAGVVVAGLSTAMGLSAATGLSTATGLLAAAGLFIAAGLLTAAMAEGGVSTIIGTGAGLFTVATIGVVAADLLAIPPALALRFGFGVP